LGEGRGGGRMVRGESEWGERGRGGEGIRERAV